MPDPETTNTSEQGCPSRPATTDSPAAGTYLCFDFGQKRIGLAVGHSDTQSANPLAVIRNINGRPEWHHIDRQVTDWMPAGLVVGLPLSDFSETPASENAAVENTVQGTTLQAAQLQGKQQDHGIQRKSDRPADRNNQQLLLSAAFSKKLRNRYNIPVYRCDERYSSIEAARLLAENRSRGNRKKVGREDLDKVAAAIILNQWFNNEFQ